jgi:hypothetical protein
MLSVARHLLYLNENKYSRYFVALRMTWSEGLFFTA